MMYIKHVRGALSFRGEARSLLPGVSDNRPTIRVVCVTCENKPLLFVNHCSMA
jgi:hypothetical protein